MKALKLPKLILYQFEKNVIVLYSIIIFIQTAVRSKSPGSSLSEFVDPESSEPEPLQEPNKWAMARPTMKNGHNMTSQSAAFKQSILAKGFAKRICSAAS